MIDKKSTMANRINKTSICSILFLDMIDYSMKSDAGQIEIKNQFNDLISLSLESVAKDDRIILDTGDGVAIAYMGSPEDLMFVALTIRDGILKGNVHSHNPLFVRFGINLGPVRIVSDINGRPNIIGDGINVAQRIMSFSEPNQILVSRSFYEITSRLTVEFSEMFAYSGIKQDKHVRDHEVYSVRSHSNQVASIGQPDTPKDERRSTYPPKVKNKFNWNYAIPSLLAIAAIITLAKLTSTPSEPIITLAKSAIATPEKVSASLPLPAKPIKDGLMPNEALAYLPLEVSQSANENKLETKSKKTLQQERVISKDDALIQEKALQEKLAKKKTRKEAKKKAHQEAERLTESGTPTERLPSRTDNPKSINKEEKPLVRPVEVAKATPEKENTKVKSFLKSFTESFHQGQKGKCTQGQISMAQCN